MGLKKGFISVKMFSNLMQQN